jgi:hypothetical protein
MSPERRSHAAVVKATSIKSPARYETMSIRKMEIAETVRGMAVIAAIKERRAVDYSR